MPTDLWAFFPLGYLITVSIEAPILYVGLSPAHSSKVKLLAGFWLTACTYPIVILVLPLIFDPGNDRGTYLLVAETFAPLAECLLFSITWGRRQSRWRDNGVIVLANLASFGLGELFYWGMRMN